MILDSALELAENGLSIIPVVGKRPAFSWEAYTQRHPTPTELRSWFSGRYEQFAIVTGRVSGVVMIDCDGPEAIRFADERLPATPMRSRTPRGGEHRYYDIDGIIGNRVGILGMLLDLRGEKGVAVEYGQGYEWLGDWSAPRPKFDPAWLPADDRVVMTTAINSANVEALWHYISKINSISGQRGHAACFRCACKIADFAAEHVLSSEQCLAMFMQWNEVCAFPKWSLGELNHKLTDAFKRKET